MRRSKWHVYSLTSSAMASGFGGTVMPKHLGFLRLLTILMLVGLAGFSPFSIRPNPAL